MGIVRLMPSERRRLARMELRGSDVERRALRQAHAITAGVWAAGLAGVLLIVAGYCHW
jgi:hypothetical protein